MKVKNVTIADSNNVVIAKLSTKIKQKKIQGVLKEEENSLSPMEILKGKRSYNFKKEFTRYVDDNYGDILDHADKKHLHEVVEEHYEDGCIENVEDLHHHIVQLGKKHGLIFD